MREIVSEGADIMLNRREKAKKPLTIKDLLDLQNNAMESTIRNHQQVWNILQELWQIAVYELNQGQER